MLHKCMKRLAHDEGYLSSPGPLIICNYHMYVRDPHAEYGGREAPIYPVHLSFTPSGVLVSLDLLGGKKGRVPAL